MAVNFHVAALTHRSDRDVQMSHKSKTHLKILIFRRVTYGKFHPENSQEVGALAQNFVPLRYRARDLCTLL